VAGSSPLSHTPFFFLGPRPYREAEVCAYIRREHRRGRPLTDILDDPYVNRPGREAVLRAALRRPSLIQALREDIVDSICLEQKSIRRLGSRAGSR
jgi:hypothetical protein